MVSDSAGGVTGYLHPTYADALSEFGQPVLLPTCAGWALQRSISGYTAVDAMGCYPLFACRDWSCLQSDLERMDRGWVGISLVADPFGDHSSKYLKTCFPDVMIPFKEHFVVDLSKPARDFVIDHHVRNARKAAQRVAVELSQDPMGLLDDWTDIYGALIRRHDIRGIAVFSRRSFTRQLQVPGLVVFRAMSEGSTVGMLLWYVMGDVAYYHLGAYSDVGYEFRASFALFSFAIDYFADLRLRWLNLGAGAGTQGTMDDGLSRFKRGWSNSMRTAYFCGRVFDRAKYQEIVSQSVGLPQTGYFPLYRYGEL